MEVTWKEYCDLLMEHSSFSDQMKIFFHWHFKDRGTPSFSDHLYDLMDRADADNFVRLRQGFPLECCIFSLWLNNGNDIRDFFKDFGLGHFLEKLKDKGDTVESPYKSPYT